MRRLAVSDNSYVDMGDVTAQELSDARVMRHLSPLAPQFVHILITGLGLVVPFAPVDNSFEAYIRGPWLVLVSFSDSSASSPASSPIVAQPRPIETG
jgi:hypothetical protein